MRMLTKLAITAGLLTALAAPAGAAARTGDVYLVDDDVQSVFKFGPQGGPPTLLINSNTWASPTGMILAPDGKLLVTDFTATVHSVDRTSGVITPFATDPGGRSFDDIVRGADGQFYLSGDGDGVYRLDPRTRQFSAVTTDPALDPSGLAATRDGRLYATDQNDQVWRIDIATGAVTPFAEADELSGGDGVAISADERHLYVAAYCQPSPNCSLSSSPPNSVVRVDLRTAAVSTVATVSDAVALSILPDGSLLSTNTQDNLLQRVTLGGQVSPFSTSGAPPFGYPHDTVVEPPRCGGRLATVVGTTGNDTLRGSRFADVIVTLAGRDTVKSLGGKDVVCGGKGKDRLLGGAGKDRLLGQGGPDVIRGGKARDICRGGGGRDNERC